MVALSGSVDDFYQGDLVEVHPRHFKPHTPVRKRRFYVSTQTPAHSAYIELCDNPYRRSLLWSVPPRNVKRVHRGNWFYHRFGRPLSFSSISDEANFWHLIGAMRELRNPADGLFCTWTHQEAEQALVSGYADAFFGVSGIAGLPADEVTYSAFSCDIPEVAARMRQACLSDIRHRAAA